MEEEPGLVTDQLSDSDQLNPDNSYTGNTALYCSHKTHNMLLFTA